MSQIFTHKEKTVKCYTVGDAINQAMMVQRANSKGEALCVNAVSGKDYSSPITLEKLSELVDDMLSDTHYYDPRNYRPW